MKSIYDITRKELAGHLEENSFSKYVADQIFGHLYKRKVFDPLLWPNVSKKAKSFLLNNYNFDLPKVCAKQISSDGTQKYLLTLVDEQNIEAVLIESKGRKTLCLSTQVGCAMQCDFCFTATCGYKRNLTPGEIVGAYLLIDQEIGEEGQITNIVYMGQGEPLNNFNNVQAATINFLDPHGLGLGQRRITLSTCGIVPQMEKLSTFPPINMAISLHSAIDEVRNELIPINKKYGLKGLREAIDKIPLKKFRRITYEYLLIDGITDGPKDLKALVEFLEPARSKVNLIPFNPYPGSKYKRPAKEKVDLFLDKLIKAGFTCTKRPTKGDDILAACGQLSGKYS